MRSIPSPLQAQFDNHLRKRAVPKEDHGLFKKWLRYYLDFCEKYQLHATEKESLPAFLGKLREKRQTKAQQQQPAFAIRLFYEISDKSPPSKRPPLDAGSRTPRKANHKDVETRQIHEDSSGPWGDRGASRQTISRVQSFRQGYGLID